jgi:ribosomal protein S18 acetylase RimI-like enzyme
MSQSLPESVRLRPARTDDLALVLRLEGDPANSPYVGSWSLSEHQAVIDAPDKDHWIIEVGSPPRRAGYMIVYDLHDSGLGVHIKRLVVDEKGRGIGRAALGALCAGVFAGPARFVWLDVLTMNERGQAAYRAAGLEARSLPAPTLAEWARAVGGIDDDSVIMVREASPQRT